MPNPDALHVVVDDLSRFRRSEATVDTEHLLTIEFFELTRSRIRAGVVLHLNLITLPGVRQFRKRVDCAAKRVRPLRHPESHPRKGRGGIPTGSRRANFVYRCTRTDLDGDRAVDSTASRRSGSIASCASGLSTAKYPSKSFIAVLLKRCGSRSL